MRTRSNRRAFGDWQTPVELARAAMVRVGAMGVEAASVLEPTCGDGAFLIAAREVFPRARLLGVELDEGHAAGAREALGGHADVRVADAFEVDWGALVASLPEPILVAGNPPWVTTSTLGALGAKNAPRRDNAQGLVGLDARTGKSNFDVSEWILTRLLDALRGRRATLAVLCKAQIARRIIARGGVAAGALFRIDSARSFDASVDAALFVARVGEGEAGEAWPVHPSFDEGATSSIARRGGVLVADVERFARTAHLAGTCSPVWRSGMKHDCADVLELAREGDAWVNGVGARVDVEDEVVWPWLKSSDVATGRARDRAVIVPQRSLREDPADLAIRAPRAFAYLSAHAERLRARRSSIYRNRPDFSVFGVGPYTFAPWKVAISGLYKRSAFALVPPRDGRAVLLDDTCYFLPFEDEARARRTHAALASEAAQDFFAGRIFRDAKRPVNKAILQALDLDRLLAG